MAFKMLFLLHKTRENLISINKGSVKILVWYIDTIRLVIRKLLTYIHIHCIHQPEANSLTYTEFEKGRL